MDGETAVREINDKEAFRTYEQLAKEFFNMNDFQTASYFYNRCLDISIEFKYIEGEALARQGLGIAEEKVFNKYKAMEHLEDASQKAKEG